MDVHQDPNWEATSESEKLQAIDRIGEDIDRVCENDCILNYKACVERPGKHVVGLECRSTVIV